MQLGIKSRRNIEKMITGDYIIDILEANNWIGKDTTCKDHFKAIKNEIEKKYWKNVEIE